MVALPKLPASRLLVGLLLCLLVFAGVALLFYEKIKRDVYNDLRSESRERLEARSQALSQHFDAARRQAIFLGNVPPIPGIIRAVDNEGVDPRGGSPLALWKERLSEIFHAYITAKPDVRQLRYIRLDDGRELVRVEQRSGEVRVVPDSQLQEKSGRSYFQAIETLGMGATYISPIELNRERGKVETPAWPTYRAAFNVVNPGEKPFGFVVINYDATEILATLSEETDTFSTLVMNGDGNFLAHPDGDLAFAHEYDLPGGWNASFDSDFQYQSDQFIAAYSRQFGPVQYLSKRAVVRSAGIDNQLYLISVVRQSTIRGLVAERFLVSLAGLGALFVVASLIIFSYHRAFQERSRRSALDSQYKAIFNRGKDAILLFDDAGEIISANPSACRLVGLSEWDLHGALLYDLFDHENHSLYQFAREFLEGGKEESTTECSFTQGGRTHELFVTLVRIGTSFHGRDVSVALINDVTDIKRANRLVESHNEELRREVSEQTKELKRLLKEAESATEAKSRFLANMSHEIRTPMNGVFGMLNLIRRDTLTRRQEKNLDLAESSVKALTALINDILDLSKIEAGRLQLENVSFDLSQLMHSCASSNSILLKDRDITFLVDIVGIKHPWVEADANRIRQVLNNLVSNAIKFTETGQIKIQAKTTAPENGVTQFFCSVTDSGIGISEDKLPHLFQSFVQETSATAREYGGTGLGLAICKHLCELMGGSIQAESKKGEGSTFSFTLPLNCLEERSEGANLRFAREEIAWVALNDALLSELVAQTFEAWEQHAMPRRPEDVMRSLRSSEEPACSLLVLSDETIHHVRDTLVGLPNDIKVVFASEKVGLLHDENAIRALPSHAGHVDQPISAVSLAGALYALDPERFHIREAVSAQKAWRPTDGWLSDKTLLVVDDHRVNREVLSGLLENSGAKVLLACDAYEATALLEGMDQGHTIDVVLMDCQMPGMDGYELTRRIRSGAVAEACKDITIIAITAAAMSNERQRCYDVGMNDYLSKPIDPDDLYRTLHQWLVGEEPPTSQGSSVEDEHGVRALNFPARDDDQIWDKTVAMAHVANLEELLVKVLDTYLETVPSSFQAIQKALSDGDREALRVAAHSLKGASANIGAVRVQVLTQSLEANALNAEKPELEALVNDLYRALEVVSITIEEELSLHRGPS